MALSESRVGISTSSFFYWADQSDWMNEQLRIIKIARRYVARLEVYFGIDDLKQMSSDQLETYQKALEGCCHSIHAPIFSKDPAESRDVLQHLSRVVKQLHAEYCVIHADNFDMLHREHILVPFGLRYGLENSDPRKLGFQHLSELNQFAPIPLVLDVDHIQELHFQFPDELAAFHNRILAAHVSTPHNPYYEKYPEIKTTHFLFARSGTVPQFTLPPDVPLVIEGVIPPNEPELIEEEIAIVKISF